MSQTVFEDQAIVSWADRGLDYENPGPTIAVSIETKSPVYSMPFSPPTFVGTHIKPSSPAPDGNPFPDISRESPARRPDGYIPD